MHQETLLPQIRYSEFEHVENFVLGECFCRDTVRGRKFLEILVDLVNASNELSRFGPSGLSKKAPHKPLLQLQRSCRENVRCHVGNSTHEIIIRFVAMIAGGDVEGC